MKKIISNLPIDANIYYHSRDRYYINNYGFRSKHESNDDIVAYRKEERRETPFFATINNNVLEINQVFVKEDESIIEFYSEKIAELIYNKEFNELEKNIIFDEYSENDNIFFVINSCILQKFFGDIITKESFYNELITKENIVVTAKSLINLYLNKYNKYLQLLIDNEMWTQVEELFNSHYYDNHDNINSTINLNIITLAKCMFGNMMLPVCANLVEKYNYTELMKLAKIAQKFNFSSVRIWEVIAEIDNISITEIGNYLVKSIFISGTNLVLASGYSMETLVYNFISMYKDYAKIRHEDEDLFPDNLYIAHDSILNRIQEEKELELKRQKEAEYAEIHKAFQKKVDKYSHLSWEYKDYNIVIPEKPEDLDIEGDEQHNCVAGYVKSVTQGISKICLMRKEKKPYITIEIRRNEIVQAKRAFNSSISDKDLEILKLWAKEKALTITTL